MPGKVTYFYEKSYVCYISQLAKISPELALLIQLTFQSYRNAKFLAFSPPIYMHHKSSPYTHGVQRVNNNYVRVQMYVREAS